MLRSVTMPRSTNFSLKPHRTAEEQLQYEEGQRVEYEATLAHFSSPEYLREVGENFARDRKNWVIGRDMQICLVRSIGDCSERSAVETIEDICALGPLAEHLYTELSLKLIALFEQSPDYSVMEETFEHVEYWRK